MIKFYTALLMFFILSASGNGATWERLYTKSNTDCFRNIKEVSGGGYIAAGYTSNFTPNDTDAFVMRMDEDGDSLWTFTYNGPSSKEDCFYKVVPISSGGYILCGYSRSFGNGDNAFYMKLSSSGVMQWVKNWGGSGIERAQDVVELPDGSFVICGYTTSSPAQYYDAFLLKIDASGNTIWTKRYGTAAYDDANSLLLLPDGGFLTGGQSNNKLYLVRSNSSGDVIWTKTFGTSGTDNIECLTFAHGGGYILAGGTTGAGAGGNDGYLVKTDSGGVQLWAKTFGGTLNDDFHSIGPTSDGGYIAVGTSSTGAWANPNYWLYKFDAGGNSVWSKIYGGDHHDHGYFGMQTSDGGYILTGHSRSYGHQGEDGLIVKTNSSGNVTDPLSYTKVINMLSPVVTTCGSANAQIQIQLENFGLQTLTSIPVTVEITGAITQTITQNYTGSIGYEQVKNMTFSTTVDMSGGGTFHFHCYTGSRHDVYPRRNHFEISLTVGGTNPPVVTNGSHCGPGTVALSASAPGTIQWYSAPSGGSSLATGSSYTTPYLFSSATYYVQTTGSCQSARVPVQATINTGLTPPTPVHGSRCGTGTVVLSSTSAYTVKWYSSATTMTVLHTGTSYTTPSISSNTTYYIQAEDASCSSTRVAVNASILSAPSAPVTVSASRCGSGSVTLSATASQPIEWFDAPVNGNLVGGGNSFTTPVISNTTSYYASANNGACSSARVVATATISSLPPDAVTTSASRCGPGTVVLGASASSSIKWYDAPSGGNQVGTGASFTTPSLSTTTNYYAAADNGCMGNRIAATATINSIPSAPSTTAGSRCGPGSVALSATASNPINWYDVSSGGSSLGTGSSFNTPVITSTKTYYAEADNGCPSSRTPAVATIQSIPSAPVTTPGARCSTGTVVLSATASGTIDWFNAPTGGSPIGTGNSFTTPVIAATTTFYAAANNGNCSSSRSSAVATVSSLPPDAVTVSASRCGSGTVTLTASASSPIKWFDAPTGGSQVGTGNSFTTPSLSSTKVYYAAADNGCEGNRIPATATINAVPSSPVTTAANRCGPGTLVLSATASNPIKWFDAASGGNQVGTGNSFTTPVLTSTKTYYAEADNGCPSARASAVATINSVPANPVAIHGARCGTGTVILGATASATIEWYDAPTGGSQLATGTSYTTPSLSSTTTYYAQTDNGTCTSSRIPVTATISASAADPVTTGGDRCGTGTVNLSASASDPVVWYDAPTGGAQVGSGNSFTTPVISVTTVFYAQADNGCVSSRIAATATVNAKPDDPVTTPADHCGSASLVLSATAADPVSWFDQPVGGNPVGTGNTFTTPVLSSTEVYYAAASNGVCFSDRVPASATIFAIPSDPVAPSVFRCGDGSIDLSASSSDSISWWDAASGGSLLGTGTSFTTPLLSQTTIYYVQAQNANCTGSFVAVTAGIHPPASVDLGSDTIVCSAMPCILDAGTGFSSYLWSTAENTPAINPITEGMYCVTVTDANNCTATDCAYLSVTVGIENDYALSEFTVYPSPARESVRITWKGNEMKYFIRVLDIHGRSLSYLSIMNDDAIDVTNFAPGMYFIRVAGSDGWVARFVVQ